ncbi:MAG: L,D-transpeptidase family protein, partial [Culicoidibacterales bacterium]
KVKESLDKGVITVDVSDCVIPPVTSEKDLENLKQEAQSYIDAPIALTLGTQKHVLTPQQKSALLAVDDKEKKVSISQDATIKLLTTLNDQFIQSQGGTTATSTVEFGGGAAKIVSSATNILTMNVETEANTVKTAIEGKTGIDYTPAVKANAEGTYTYKNGGANISKNSRYFVEVSIPQQKLWIYQGDKIILDADVVTGNESSGKFTPTVRGLFQILYKQQGATLRGSTVGYTGAQDYNVKVNYWIPFESNGYGFHDAEGWKPYARYGGTYYKSEGSHGCVNMRNKDVKALYDTVSAGTPVWVHE